MIDISINDKILTIGPSPKMKGGIAQVIRTYFNEIFPNPKFIPETTEGTQLQRILCSISAIFRLFFTLTTDKNIKIVHIHTASGISFQRSSIFAKISRIFGKATILHIHGANFKEYSLINKKTVTHQLSKANCVVALSESWLNYFVKGLNIPHTRIIPNIVEEPHITSLRSNNDKITHALFLGQLGKRKGIYDLLKAIKESGDKIDGKFYLHIGGNGEIDKVNKMITELGLNQQVYFHGWITGENKIELLNQCSVFILPSYAEGLPISILEAMSYGNAVIATPVGGIPEIVDSSNGILVNPGDIGALSNAISIIVNSPEQLRQMGKSSVDKSKIHLSPFVAKKLEQLYTDILSHIAN